MISQRDSKINTKMSNFSSEIAMATKADGAAMKTIALVTLTFLPSTFVTVSCPTCFDLLLDRIASSDFQFTGTSRYELLHHRLKVTRRTSAVVERLVDFFRYCSAAHNYRIVPLVVVADERRRKGEEA
jgi:hypothetical protein